MMDPTLNVNFDGGSGLAFNQGEDRSILITIANALTRTPINLTGATAGINMPLQGGGSIKRTSGVVAVPYTGVNIAPTSTISLTDHGLVTGDPVTVAAQGGGTLPGGLVAATNYLIKVLDANTFQLTDTSGNILTLTTQGTLGFNISNVIDLVVSAGDLGQIILTLRHLVSASVNAELAQNFQVQYTIAGLTRIIVIPGLLDVTAQPVQ